MEAKFMELVEFAIDASKVEKNEVNIVKNPNMKNFFKFRKITKIVYDKNEDSIEKLTSVFNAVNNIGADVAYVLINKKNQVDFYIGVITENQKLVSDADEILEYSIKSNFEGCEIEEFDREFKSKFENEIKEKKSISLSVALPSFKNEDEKKEKFIQSLDKFIKAMEDKEFVGIFLAKNASEFIQTRKSGFEELYTLLYPMLNNDISISENISFTVGESETQTFSKTLSESISKTHSTQKMSAAQKMQMNLGILNPIPLILHPTFQGSRFIYNKGKKFFTGKEPKEGYYDSSNESESNTTTTSTTNSHSTSVNRSQTKGQTFQRTIKSENRYIKSLIEQIDKHLERIDTSKNYGMFDFCAYFLANDNRTSILAANVYNSLIKGEDSYLVTPFTYVFNSEDEVKEIKNYLLNFEHPKFKKDNQEFSFTTLVNSKELSIAMSLPKKSVNGIYVKESVEFGLNYKKLKDRYIELGNLYNLGKEYKNIPVRLNLDDLTMHTLLVGSTGSGKSTTTYNMIRELELEDIKILVIEPTKGEYKNVFGNKFKVYGTNKKLTPLLRINPFSFEDDIHVLEHVDRLIEIFNACWPMYAAMPAVLKDAILDAYEKCGWDLDESENKNKIFPTFRDVLESLEEILESSEYSDNTKADYKGALITRIKSLTRGIVGNIFVENELSSKELFDENVIVDLSRVGSSETKSLIMGVLLLKLQEYRMSSGVINSNLKHITILEEAHHLLPRVSKEVSNESANIKGKAVEMLSNSIAEMRTYGEGFLIIDQSPNMLDLSAIKNTNTKIVLRLPEKSDKEDIGKSLSLSEEQINEISKFERGVGIVYQNGWEEPILCKIHKPKVRERKYKYTPLVEKKFDKEKIVKAILNNDKEAFSEAIKDIDFFQKYKNFDLESRIKLLDELIDLKKIYKFRNNSKLFEDYNENEKKKLLKYAILYNIKEINSSKNERDTQFFQFAIEKLINELKG